MREMSKPAGLIGCACGGDALMPPKWAARQYVECEKCHRQGPSKSSRKAAKEAWRSDRRAITNHDALVEMLKAAQMSV